MESDGVRWDVCRDTEHDAHDVSAHPAHRLHRHLQRRQCRRVRHDLRALRDLRRYTGPVIVQNGGQLNVANQQVNVKQACMEK